MKRVYDLGEGFSVEDDGYTLVAIKRAEHVTSSQGVRRPKRLPKEGTTRVEFSRSGDYFYLTGFAGMHGFWMGVKKWADREEMKAQQPTGLFGKAGCEIQRKDSNETYYRELLHFTVWSLKSGEVKELPVNDELVLDYYVLVLIEIEAAEKKFNEFIAPTGKDLTYIMGKIGPWVTPEELPVVPI